MRKSSFVVVFSMVMVAATAQAKDPFNPISDLTGLKVIQVQMNQETKNSFSPSKMQAKSDWSKAQKKPKTQYLKGEFLYHGGNELWLVNTDGVTQVRASGLGSGHFSWQDDQGRDWVIPNYPWDNNHAPVSGMIISGGDMVVGKFTLIASKPRLRHNGRWAGVVAFPGGAQLDIAVQIAVIGSKLPTCSGRAYPMRIEIPGSPYMDTELLRCKKMFNNGPLYAQFFHWDEHNGNLWFFTINGNVYYKGTVFQGTASVFPILGEGQYTEGKFYMTRPQPFAL